MVISPMKRLHEANRDEFRRNSPFYVTQEGVMQAPIHKSTVNRTGDEFHELFILLHHARLSVSHSSLPASVGI